MLTPTRRTEMMRTSDEERQRVADFLRDACADGRLTTDELDERLDDLWAGRTAADLQRLVADLPGGAGVLPRPFGHGRPRQPARRRPHRLSMLVAFAGLVAAVVVLASLPEFLAWTLLAVIIGLAVTTIVFAVALAPFALIGFAIAWAAGRLFRGRAAAHPWGSGCRRSGPF